MYCFSLRLPLDKGSHCLMRMLKPLQRCPGVSKFVSTLETSSVFMNNKTLNLEIQYDEILICIDF